MGVLMGGTEFLRYLRKTNPQIVVPGSVQAAIPVHKIYQDGIFDIEGGSQLHVFDKCYLMDDINYKLMDDTEKEAVLLTLCKIFNSLNVDFKILVANATRDMEQFLKDILFSEEGEYQAIAKENNQWIIEGLKKGTPEICQIRYLVISVRKKDYEEAKAYFNGLDAVIMPLFESLKSHLRPLTAVERLEVMYGIYRPKHQGGFHITWEGLQKTGRDWKNEVLPARIDSEKDYLKINDTYAAVLFSYALPNSLDEGKVMAELTNLPFPSMATLDHAPFPRVALKNKFLSALSNNERAIHKEQERRIKAKNYVAGVSYTKQKKKQEIEGYLEQIDDNDENGYFFSVLITVFADTLEELRNRMETIRFIGEGLGGIEFEPYYHRQLKALHTALPMGSREVDCMRGMVTSSLVAFQPFYSKDIIQPSGQFCGVNRTTKNIIMLDRKKLKNGNGFISGHTGSGKSMFLKSVEIVQTLIGTQDDVFVIDPQNELQQLCPIVKGQFFDLSAQSKVYLNFLEIPDSVRFSEDLSVKDIFVAEQAEFAEAFCYSCMKGISPTGIHKSIITNCIMRLYDKFFQDRKLQQPMLFDFYSLLQEYEKENARDEQEAREIYKPLEAYCLGTNDMFAHNTNLDIHNRFVVFGMKNISKGMWETVMLVVMHLLKQRINYNQSYQRATHFIVDEGQVVCKNQRSAEQLEKAFLTYRKFGGICTLVVQNMTAAQANDTVKNLVSNCDFKAFFDQGGTDRQEIADIIELSSAEYAALNEDIPGQCVIIYGKDVLLCDSRILKENPLYNLYQTSFHERIDNATLHHERPKITSGQSGTEDTKARS